MLSIFFYLTFLFFAFCGPLFIVSKRYKGIALLSLIFTAQFNVTSFLKVGITISFFEMSLFFTALIILLLQPKILKEIVISKIDLVLIVFLSFCFLSAFIAQIRISMGNLIPVSLSGEVPFFRSIMSLNKLIIYFPALLIIRTHLLKHMSYEEFKKKFLICLMYSGVAPSIAVIVQFFGLGFYLIHNNPSFSETFHIVDYYIERPVGLTNEASFFVYQLFFPFMALVECYHEKYIGKRKYIFLILFFVVSIIFSLSRAGILIYSMYALYKIFSRGFSFKYLIYVSIFLVIAFFALKNVTISNFNVYDRLLSSFEVEADLSTIERYGSSEAILNLMFDKGLLFGVGIFNYGFYVMGYLPDYMDVIDHYDADHGVPSFNFILQLAAEFGLPLFLLFIFISVSLIRKVRNSFLSGWFLFLFVFSLTFQALNFAVPFLIFLFPCINEKNNLFYR